MLKRRHLGIHQNADCMKQLLTTLFLIICVKTGALGQQSGDTREFKTYFQAYVKAYEMNPSETLRKGAVKDYRMLGGDGKLRDLETTCTMFANATNVYCRIENEEYRVYGTTGVVTGTSYWGFESPQTGKYDAKSLLTYVFTRTEAGWKQVSGHHIDVKTN